MAARAGLSAAELLEIVDEGSETDAVGRGQVLLAAAAPDAVADELSLGQRDSWVLELRCATYGDTLLSRVQCVSCGLLLTVRIPRSHVLAGPPWGPVGPAARVDLTVGDVRVSARAPDGAALAAAAATGDLAAARASLVAACIVSAERGGEPVDPLSLDDTVVEAVGEALVAAEPTLEMRLPMRCAACGLEWSPVLDIVHYFWRELSAESDQILDDVHALAVGYGWFEDQVLTLSARRRRQYIDRLASG